MELVDLVGVEAVSDHRLRLTFADGVVGEWKGVLAPLADPTFFAQVRVDAEAGTIAWPNGVDFAPEPLYEEARRGQLQRQD